MLDYDTSDADIISSMFIDLVLMAHACLKNRIPGRIYVILWEIAF